MSEMKSNKLPVKIIANSAETFAKLEAVIKKLPEGFIKQFETVEQEGLTGTMVFKSRPLSGEFFCIGNIINIKQDKEKVKYLSSLLNMYVIRTELKIAGKKELFWLEALIYDSYALAISASTDCEIK